MTQRLTRETSIDAFREIYAQLDALHQGKHPTSGAFIFASKVLTAMVDRGALVIPAIPTNIDLAAMWRYQDKGILPEDRGAPFFAFLRRLAYFHSASKRILDILVDDVVWQIHVLRTSTPVTMGTPAGDSRADTGTRGPGTDIVTHMAWTPLLTSLRNTLAGLFSEKSDIRSLIDESGIPLEQVAFGDRPLGTWHDVLRQADQRGRLQQLVTAALTRYPDHPELLALRTGNPYTSSERVPVDWHGQPSARPTLEKLTGIRSTLLPISFLARGVEAARSVARVLLPGGVGSGFLIARNLLITNWHVLPDKATALSAQIQFNYQKTPAGVEEIMDTFVLDPDAFFAASEPDDWAIVRVKDKDGGEPNARWGELVISSKTVSIDDTVNIIQHPGGGHKQVALYHNYVAFVDDRIVQYLTDTLPGSSGSPVFNDDWQVVALHHAGGDLEEPKGQFLRNEGIRISVIVAALKSHGLRGV